MPPCPVCRDTGMVQCAEQDGSGVYEQACPEPVHDGQPCPICSGRGWLESDHEMTEVLHRDPAITCQWDVPDWEDAENGLVPCPSLSWFVVERSDGDKSFGWDGKHEACEYHVADVIDGMLSGDEKLHAIVTPRWWDDAPEGTPLELREPEAAPKEER